MVLQRQPRPPRRLRYSGAGELLMDLTNHEALYAEFLDQSERATSIMAMLDNDHDLADSDTSPHVIDYF